MNKPHRPHQPKSNGPTRATTGSTQRPRPLCNRGGRAVVCCEVLGPSAQKSKRGRCNQSEPWPPPEYALPNTIEAIERGRIVQAELFDEQPDDSRAGRVARITTPAPRTKVLPPAFVSKPHTANLEKYIQKTYNRPRQKNENENRL